MNGAEVGSAPTIWWVRVDGGGLATLLRMDDVLHPMPQVGF